MGGCLLHGNRGRLSDLIECSAPSARWFSGAVADFVAAVHAALALAPTAPAAGGSCCSNCRSCVGVGRRKWGSRVVCLFADASGPRPLCAHCAPRAGSPQALGCGHGAGAAGAAGNLQAKPLMSVKGWNRIVTMLTWYGASSLIITMPYRFLRYFALCNFVTSAHCFPEDVRGVLQHIPAPDWTSGRTPPGHTGCMF